MKVSAKRRHLLLLLLLHLPVAPPLPQCTSITPSKLADAVSSSPSSRTFSSFFQKRKSDDGNNNTKYSKKAWSSRLLTIDPAKILSTLIKHGGLLIPKSAEKDIDVLKQVLNVEKAELNVVEKELVLYNFTVSTPTTKQRQQQALRIGRVYVRWDSYLKPCIEVEVDDVDILVEFTNLMLTRTNWNELKEIGFPPEMLAGETASDDNPAEAQSSFVRFSSIDLSGNITVRVSSRPLGKDIGVFALDLDMTDDVNDSIRKLSDSNLLSTGRRGCTSTELAALLQVYVGQKVRSFLASAAYDIATKSESSFKEVDRMLTRASEHVLGYASEAGRKKGEDIEEAIAATLGKWGISSASEKIKALKKQTIDSLNRPDERAKQESHREDIFDAENRAPPD